MKNLRNAAMLVLLSAGITYAQNITVQGEKKLNTDFRKYKTFGWLQSDKPADHVIAYYIEEYAQPVSSSSDPVTRKERKKNKNAKNEDVVIYSYSYTIPSEDSIMNRTLVHAVNSEMEGHGYLKDNASPDLLVAYKIFDQSSKIKGYNNNAPAVLNGKEVYQSKDTVSYRLKPGSILITLIDSKTGSVVWEGYASGVARNNDIINDKLRVEEAINLIFKKYEFRGDKYSMNN